MNRYDMSEYLSLIECCNDISSTWTTDSSIDPNRIIEIKMHLQNFIMQNKSEIMSMYDYAETIGKYQVLDIPDVLPVMEKFEAYYVDLSVFMNEIISLTDESKLSKNSLETIVKAADADKNFFNRYFDDNTIDIIHVTYPEALSQIEVLLHFDTLLGEIYDMYIKLSDMGNTSDRVSMLIDLYGTSTMKFFKAMSNEIYKYLNKLIDVKNGIIEKRKVIGSYRLI